MSDPTPEQIFETDPVHREINSGLMVRWINQDLFARCANDVRVSTVLYDGDKLFVAALPAQAVLTEKMAAHLYANHAIRFWSKGIV